MLFSNFKVNVKEEVVELDALKLNATYVKRHSLYYTDPHYKYKSNLKDYYKSNSRNKASIYNVRRGLADYKTMNYSQLTSNVSTSQNTPMDYYLSRNLTTVRNTVYEVRSKIVKPMKCAGDIDIVNMLII